MKYIESVSEKLGSEWGVGKINTINLNIARYKPIRRGNSFAYTPKSLV